MAIFYWLPQQQKLVKSVAVVIESYNENNEELAYHVVVVEDQKVKKVRKNKKSPKEAKNVTTYVMAIAQREFLLDLKINRLITAEEVIKKYLKDFVVEVHNGKLKQGKKVTVSEVELKEALAKLV